jgi:hypothetical protein
MRPVRFGNEITVSAHVINLLFNGTLEHPVQRSHPEYGNAKIIRPITLCYWDLSATEYLSAPFETLDFQKKF